MISQVSSDPTCCETIIGVGKTPPAALQQLRGGHPKPWLRPTLRQAGRPLSQQPARQSRPAAGAPPSLPPHS